MKRLLTLLFWTIACGTALAQPAECSTRMQLGDGYLYSMDRVADFVSKEIRPELSRVDRPFKLRVIRSCPGSKDQIVEWGMRAVDLYILRWNREGEPEAVLTDDEVRYTNDELEISTASFERAVTDALTLDSQPLVVKQRTVKMFAFVVAEAARFSDVETSVKAVFSGRCSVKWSEYSRLLRSWRLISVFANSKALITGTPYIGGSRAFLIAPVTSNMVAKYNEAIANGWLIDEGRTFEPPEKLDPVRDTARLGALACPTN